MIEKLRLAGFGGQGVIFMGKALAHAGMVAGQHVTWVPSYGPEMRGGTANCSVIISDSEIGEPVAVNPDILVAFNEPSLRKFLPAVAPGGVVLINSSLIKGVPLRDDVRAIEVPVNDLARSAGSPGLINMVMLGALLPHLKSVTRAHVEEAIRESVPAGKQHLLDANFMAVAAGLEATGGALPLA